MSNTAVENEVVRMQFDNRQFEAGVKQSMSTLDKLKAALHLDKSAQGFKQIGDAAKKVNFNPITNGIEGVKKSFTYMDVAFATAVARMTNDAITAGKRIASALTIDPVKTGMSEYETKLNAVQVMKSNKGGSIEEINQALDELNRYADKTIYNFTQMTNNVGKFVAQGMTAKEASKAVEGMANLAGASGASAEDMARATYQMSQAMGGTIRKIDWNSLRNANMATMQLKDVLKTVAKTEYGTDVDALIKKAGTFEDTLEEGWLSGDLFKRAMEMYSDVYSEAELKQKGYTEAQIKMFKDLAKEAAEATTSVKTLSQLWDVIKETAQSGWTQSWEWIIGDLDEAKRIWTNLNNMISGYIDKVSTARNKLLEVWATGFKDGDKHQSQLVSPALLTGREEVLLGLSEFAHSITAIVESIRAAFRDIFPPMTGRRLVELSHGFRKLMQAIKPTYTELENIFYAVRGVFSIVGLFKDILAEVIKALFPVFSTARDLNEVILQAAGFIGQLLYATTKWLRESGAIHTVVAGISKVIGELLKQIGRIIVQIFRIVHETGLDRFIVKLIGWIGNGLVYAIEHVVTLVTKFADILERVVPKIKAFFGGLVEAIKSGQLIDYLVDKFKNLGKVISEIGKGDGTNTLFTKLGKFYSAAIDVISKAVVATYKWAKSLDLTQGISIALSIIFGTLLFRLSGLVKAMTLFTKNWSAVGTSISKFFNRIRMHNPIILELAIFVGILAASLKLVSTIKVKNIIASAVAIGILAGAMTGMGIALTKVTKGMEAMPREQIFGLIAIFTTMAITLVSLSKSIRELSSISIGGLAKGIISIGVIMLELVGISMVISKFAPKLTVSGAIMLLFASTLAFAIKKLINIDWTALNGISKEMLWTASLLGAAALALGIGTEKLALSITRIAAGALMIAGAFYLINKIKINHRVAKDIGVAVSALVGIIIAVGWAGYVMQAEGPAIKQFSKGIVRITSALLAMVVTMKIAETIKKYHKAARVIEDIVGYMVLIISLIAWQAANMAINAEGIKQLGRTMLLLAVSMSIMATTMTAISAVALIPGGIKMLKAAGGILLALTVCVGGLIFVSRYGGEIKIMPILAMMMGLSAIFTELVILAGMQPDKLKQATWSILGVIVALGVAIFALSKISMADAPGQVAILASFVAIMLSFSASMSLLCSLDWATMNQRIAAMLLTLVTLEGIVLVASGLSNLILGSAKEILFASATLATIAGAMLLVAAAFAIVPKVFNVAALTTIIVGLAALIGSFAILGNWGAAWAESITLLAGSLTTLGGSMWVLVGAIATLIGSFAAFAATLWWISTLDLTKGIEALVVFIGTIGILSAFTPAIVASSGALFTFALAVLTLSAATVVGGFGITSMAIGLERLASIGADNILELGVGLAALVWPTLKLSVAGVAVLFAVPGILGIAGALILLNTINLFSIASGLEVFSVAIANLVPDFLTLIGSSIGISIFGDEISKLEPSLAICALAMKELVLRMSDFIRIKDVFIAAGNQIGQGLKNGLVEGIKVANNTLARGANTMIDTFSSIMGIHSPSRVFYNLGLYLMKGLANGEKDGTDEVTAVLGDATKQMTNTVEEGTDGLIASGKMGAQKYVNSFTSDLTSGATKQKVSAATQQVGDESGKTASNKTASAILATANVIANAAANAGNGAGASFISAMASIVETNMPKITGYVNGMLNTTGVSSSGYVGKFNHKTFDPTKVSYDEYATAFAQNKDVATEVKTYFEEQYGQQWHDYYKEWEQGTTENFKQVKVDTDLAAKWGGAISNNLETTYDWIKDGGITKAFAGDDAFDMSEIENKINSYMGSAGIDLSSGIYDYSSKVGTQLQLTQKEMDMLVKTGDIQVKSMSESRRATQVRRYKNMEYTEDKLKADGWEWNEKDKRWYKYYTVDAKGNETAITKAEEMSNSIDGLSNSMKGLKDSTQETETEMETFTKALNSNLKSAMNYFDEFKYGTEEDKISKKDLLKNLEDQHNGMISWAKDMQELASRGMSKDLWKNLAEEGPASYAKVKAFLDMTASELQQANDWFSRDLALPDVTTVYMQQLLGSYYGDYSELFIARGKAAGEDLNKGTKEGLEKNLDETKAAAESAGSQVADKYTHDGTGEGSPSWKTREAGEFMNLGLIEGLKNNLKMVLRFAAKCGDTIVKMYSRNLDPKLMRSIGKSMMVGLINGITSETNHLFKLIDEITSKVPKFIKDGWGIKSPSRLFKSFGMYAMEGLALGLSQYSTLAEAAASETADNTAKTLNGITNSVLDWDMDFNPVITPTLNLDNVTRGVREINDMFKETTLDTVVEDPVQNGGTTTQPSTTFIQNNYSPKHLASIDIYRQTRNQLSSLKGAMG